MEWSASTLWWIAAGILVAVELATGTFYLLMMALGLAAAALAAHAGLPGSAQLVAAAVVGGGATAAWHFKRYRMPSSAPVERNRDAQLDVGQTVRVETWSPDRTTTVQYRGAAWQARLADGEPAVAGAHRVAAVEANRLVLAPAPAPGGAPGSSAAKPPDA
jgi:membrane protein implicated in regulation of membrane protease activity